MNKKIIGILGGMGPLATSDLFKKVIINTKASKDQEHIRVIVDNNTQIPDRTAAILSGGENPLPKLIESARLLEDMGADLLIMPCNTAHYFYKNVVTNVGIPLLNMIEITLNTIMNQGMKKVALFATDGTVQAEIYQKVFENSDVELILPDSEGQKAVMDMIYNGVKAGKEYFDTQQVRNALNKLILLGAEAIILGCTELPLAKEMYKLDYPCIDPTLELAKEAIKLAGYCCVE